MARGLGEETEEVNADRGDDNCLLQSQGDAVIVATGACPVSQCTQSDPSYLECHCGTLQPTET